MWDVEAKKAWLLAAIEGRDNPTNCAQARVGITVGKAVAYIHKGFEKIGLGDFAEGVQLGMTARLSQFEINAAKKAAQKAQGTTQACPKDSEETPQGLGGLRVSFA